MKDPTVSVATNATPFAKSTGGKRKLVPELLKRMPATCINYHEPFVGGGALFWALANAGAIEKRAHLGDMNADLIAAYRAIQDDPEALIQRLRRMPNEASFYDRLRKKDSTDMDVLTRAARFVFLNKTSFNGIWRVNRKGEMNAPFGKYERPLICDAPNLRACSARLAIAQVAVADFEVVLKRVKQGDFLYADSPYYPVRLTEGRSFTGYTAGGFAHADQVRLRDVAIELRKRKVDFLLSNSSAPQVYELYDGFTIETVHAARSVNSKGDARGEVPEVLISAR